VDSPENKEQKDEVPTHTQHNTSQSSRQPQSIKVDVIVKVKRKKKVSAQIIYYCYYLVCNNRISFSIYYIYS
jgi:hypothetical protein